VVAREAHFAQLEQTHIEAEYAWAREKLKEDFLSMWVGADCENDRRVARQQEHLEGCYAFLNDLDDCWERAQAEVESNRRDDEKKRAIWAEEEAGIMFAQLDVATDQHRRREAELVATHRNRERELVEELGHRELRATRMNTQFAEDLVYQESRVKIMKTQLETERGTLQALRDTSKTAFVKLSFLECMNCGEMVGQKAARCPSGHPLCSTCLDEELVAAVANKTEKPVGCSMCSTQDLHVPIHTNEIAQTAGGEIFARYVGMLAESRAMKQVQQELLIVPKTGAVSLELRTPCCGTVFGGFHGCCAINCFECPGKMFCAFCFEVFEKGPPGEEDPCHSHLQDCSLNTSHVEYFAEDESQKNNVWLCFDAQRSRQANGGERFPKPMDV
jgi:hypothetical protein